MIDGNSKKQSKKIVKALKKQGVIFVDSNSCIIEKDVVIESGAVIFPNNVLVGKTVVKSGAILQDGNYIENSEIGEKTKVFKSVILNSKVSSNCTVGPFAYIRPDCNIGDTTKIGSFVEIKKSVIKNNVKVPHLSYVGDATIGEKTNIGCGVIFANYNGKEKFKTEIGKNCFIGCNTNLIAPISVEDNCFIAGGSTITSSLKEATYAISRDKQRVYKNKNITEHTNK